MAFDAPSAEDAAVLIERQAQVRAWSLRLAEAVEAIDLPESFLDGERAARAIIVADRMLVRLPEPDAEPETELDEDDEAEMCVTPARRRLRVFADQVFDVITDLPMPRTFLDAERAGRCALATARLFTQLYAPSKPSKGTLEDIDLDLGDAGPADTGRRRATDETTDAISTRLLEDVDQLTLAHARATGFYPDGSVCDPVAPADHGRLVCPQEAGLMSEWLAAAASGTPEDGIDAVARIMAGRANASTRAAARHTGHWPDGSAYRDDAPDAWAISKAFAAEVLQRPGPRRADLRAEDDERPRPPGFPWWLVRNPDTG